MSISFDPVSVGKTAQDTIDKFIGYWIDGVKILSGDPKPTDKAPIPFMASGSGYYKTYNDGIVATTDPANRAWCYARVNWQVSNEHTELHTVGITIPNHIPEWADAVTDYWGAQPIEVTPDYDYIDLYDVVSYKYKFINDSTNPTHIIGMNSQNQGDFDNYSNIYWKKYDGSNYATSHRITIQNNAGYVNSSYQAIGEIMHPIVNNQLVLPMASDAYWFYCGRPSGNSNLQMNFYNTFDSHNTNNNYYDNTTYNDYYNTYNVQLNPDLNFDIGVGPLGVFIGVGGVGVAPVNVNPEIDFDDLIDILTPVVNDLNNNDAYGIDFDIQLHDFDYYLNYVDTGDFYIEPLHQYDQLPSAPAFDGTVDFGDIPKVVGESANSYLGLLGGSLSALLCGCFITALIVRKMGR